MDILELAKQYDEEADVLKRRIQELKRQLQTQRGREVFDLEKRIALLQVEMRDLRWHSYCMRKYDRKQGDQTVEERSMACIQEKTG